VSGDPVYLQTAKISPLASPPILHLHAHDTHLRIKQGYGPGAGPRFAARAGMVAANIGNV
jgi:hypothetical protein